MKPLRLTFIALVAAVLLAGSFLHPATGSAAGIVTQSLDSLTATDLANNLAGSGVSVSNVTHTGADVAAGTFTGGAGIIGFDSGVVLSSGDVANVVGPNVDNGISTEHGFPGDADLTTLAGLGTEDASVLEFDIVPTGNLVSFLYVFASDEYNDFVNSEFNDVFGFFINGTNCATVPGTNTPVTINTINDGGPDALGEPPVSHPELFVNNDFQDGSAPLNTEMDGLTVVLTCTATVTPNATNHVKLAIADGSDDELDSDVFIEAQSLVVPTATATARATTTPCGTSTSTPTSTATEQITEESAAVQALAASCGNEIVRTATPTATSTAASTATSVATVATTPSPVVAPATSTATPRGGNVGGVIQGPNTGSGGAPRNDASTDWIGWLAALATVGVVAAGSAAVTRRTATRR
jgi:hypothetical protein